MEPRQSAVPGHDQKPEATHDPLERPGVAQSAGEGVWNTERWCRIRRVSLEVTEVIEETWCRHG